MDTASWVMATLGAGLLLAGLLTVARSRRPVEVEEHTRDGSAPPPARSRMDRLIDQHRLTTPTIIVIGMSLAISGYHLVAWALPPTWLPIRIDASVWWALPLGSMVLVVASRAIDRLED